MPATVSRTLAGPDEEPLTSAAAGAIAQGFAGTMLRAFGEPITFRDSLQEISLGEIGDDHYWISRQVMDPKLDDAPDHEIEARTSLWFEQFGTAGDRYGEAYSGIRGGLRPRQALQHIRSVLRPDRYEKPFAGALELWDAKPDEEKLAEVFDSEIYKAHFAAEQAKEVDAFIKTVPQHLRGKAGPIAGAPQQVTPKPETLRPEERAAWVERYRSEVVAPKDREILMTVLDRSTSQAAKDYARLVVETGRHYDGMFTALTPKDRRNVPTLIRAMTRAERPGVAEDVARGLGRGTATTVGGIHRFFQDRGQELLVGLSVAAGIDDPDVAAGTYAALEESRRAAHDLRQAKLPNLDPDRPFAQRTAAGFAESIPYSASAASPPAFVLASIGMGQELRDKLVYDYGVEPAKAASVAAPVTVLNAIIEKLQVSGAIGDTTTVGTLVGKKFANRLARFGARSTTEFGENFAQEIGQEFIEAAGDEIATGDFDFERARREVAAASKEIAGVTGWFVATGLLARKGREMYRERFLPPHAGIQAAVEDEAALENRRVAEAERLRGVSESKGAEGPGFRRLAAVIEAVRATPVEEDRERIIREAGIDPKDFDGLAADFEAAQGLAGKRGAERVAEIERARDEELAGETSEGSAPEHSRVSRGAIQSALMEQAIVFPGAATTRVFQSAQEAIDDLPDTADREATAQRVRGGVYALRGADGIVRMVADNLSSVDEALAKFAHEQFVHRGLDLRGEDGRRTMLQGVRAELERSGVPMGTALAGLQESYGELARRYEERTGVAGDAQLYLLEERIARAAEKIAREEGLDSADRSVWKAFVGWVRDFLKLSTPSERGERVLAKAVRALRDDLRSHRASVEEGIAEEVIPVDAETETGQSGNVQEAFDAVEDGETEGARGAGADGGQGPEGVPHRRAAEGRGAAAADEEGEPGASRSARAADEDLPRAERPDGEVRAGAGVSAPADRVEGQQAPQRRRRLPPRRRVERVVPDAAGAVDRGDGPSVGEPADAAGAADGPAAGGAVGEPEAEVAEATTDAAGETSAGPEAVASIADIVEATTGEPVLSSAPEPEFQKGAQGPAEETANLGSNFDLRQLEPVRMTPSERRRANERAKGLLDRGGPYAPEELLELSQYTGAGGLERGTVESLNQHYTDYETTRAIFDAIDRAGFAYRTALEPAAGAGNFVGMRPDAEWTTVDIDATNHEVVKALYPEGTHYNVSFEVFRKKGFDLVVSNVPFSEQRGAERRENRPDVKALHDFYFVHAADLVRDNGIVAFVTSTGTMDKLDGSIRAEVASKMDVLAAFRLPEGHFRANAQTDVTTDVIFLQKRPAGGTPTPEQQRINDAWAASESRHEGIPLNRYYVENPQNVLGTLAKGKNKLYAGRETWTVTGDADLSRIAFEYRAYPEARTEKAKPAAKADAPTSAEPPRELAAFRDWAERSGAVSRTSVRTTTRSADGKSETQTVASQGFEERLFIQNGTVYAQSAVVEFGDVQGFGKVYEPGTGDIGEKVLRLDEIARLASEFQKTGDGNAAERAIERIAAYQGDFGKHPSKDSALKAFLRKHDARSWESEFRSLFSEDFVPADVFSIQTRYTGSGRQQATASSPLMDRAFASENGRGEIDVANAPLLNGGDIPALLESGYALAGMTDAGPTLQNDALYYSGDIYGRIEQAVAMAADATGATKDVLARQIEKLHAVKQVPKTLDDIYIKGTEGWLAPILLEARVADFRQNFDKDAGKTVFVPQEDREGVYERFLNNNALISRKESDGIPEPMAEYLDRLAEAQDYVEERIAALKKRIAADPNLRERVEYAYNARFRSYVRPDYEKAKYLVQDVLDEIARDGSLPAGLRQNQIAWMTQAAYERRGINAHDVGGGKTFASIALARVLKRRGIAKKPLFVVPAKTIRKWERDIRTLFPNAVIVNLGNLAADKRADELFRLANTNADYVLISHEGFAQIQLPADVEARFVADVVKEHIEDPARVGRKQALLKQKADLYLRALQDDVRDTRLTFDKLGIDALFADEAHAFKNIGIRSDLVKFGIGVPFELKDRDVPTGITYVDEEGITRERTRTVVSMQSDRSYDFRFKANWIAENNNGGNVFLLTATPTPNKPMEIYTMLRHLAADIFHEFGIVSDVGFSNVFFQLGTVQDPARDRPKSILAGIRNAQELRGLLNRFVDKLSMEQMPWIKIPEEQTVETFLEQSPEYALIAGDMTRRQGSLPKPPKAGDDTLVAIYTGGRSASVDPRLYSGKHAAVSIDSRTFDVTTDKIEHALEEIAKVAAANPRAGQIVFLDNAGHALAEGGRIAEDIHTEIKRVLVERGIFRPEQIAIINGKVVTNPATGKDTASGDKDSKKQAVADAYNEGSIRLIIGTTASAGEGMDLQKPTTDIYHLDIPYTPGAIRQRNGRGIRYGNVNQKVRTHFLFMKGTFDALSFGIVANKKGWNEALWDKEVADYISTEEEMAEGAIPRREQILVELETDPVRKQLLVNRIQYDRLGRDAFDMNRRVQNTRHRLDSARGDDAAHTERLRQRTVELEALAPDPTVADPKKRAESFERRKASLESGIAVSTRLVGEIGDRIATLEKRLAEATKSAAAARRKLEEFAADHVVRGEVVLSRDQRAVLGLPEQVPQTETRFALPENAGEARQIEAAAKESGVWMKAPDGKPSRLNARQWAQVRTRAFVEWFGDWRDDPANASKAVDESGEPKVYFHGTSDSGFAQFDTYGANHGLFGTGSYFTDSATVASGYTAKGRGQAPGVHPAFLNIRRPIDMAAPADLVEWRRAFPDVAFAGDIATNEAAYRAVEEDTAAAGFEMWEGAEIVQDGLVRMGFDGIAHVGGGRVKPDGPQHNVLVAFHPEQIKSAVGNRGTFDAGNPDTRFAVADEDERLRRAATVQIARRMVDGQSVGVADVLRFLPGATKDEAAIVVASARSVADAVRQRFETLKGDAEIARELRSEEIRQHYARLLDEARRLGRDEERELQEAWQTIREDRRRQREIERTSRRGLGAGEMEAAGILLALEQATAAGEESVAQALGTLAEAIRARNVKDGAYTDRRENWRDHPVFRVDYRRSLSTALGMLALRLTYGRQRSEIEAAIRRLRDTVQIDATERIAREVLARIDKARVRESKEAILKEIARRLAPYKRRPAVRSDSRKDRIDRATALFLHLVRKVLHMTGPEVSDAWREAQEKYGRADFEGRTKGEEAYLETERDDALLTLRALALVGGIRGEESTPADAAFALQQIETVIRTGQLDIARKREDQRERAQEVRAAVAPAVQAAHAKLREKPAGSLLDQVGTSPLQLKLRFDDLIRYASGEARTAAEEPLDDLSDRFDSASQRAHLHQVRAMEGLHGAIKDIWGRDADATTVIAELMAPRRELARFSADRRTKLSRASLLQIHATMHQQWYRRLARHNKHLAARLDALPEIDALLDAKEFALMDWMRDWFADERPEISAVSERMIGLPVQSPDPLYFPAAISPDREGFSEIHQSVQEIPGTLEPRVPHNRDLDENADVFTVFADRVQTNAQFIHFAELNRDTLDTVLHRHMQQLVATTYGDPYLGQLRDHLTDVAVGHPPAGGRDMRFVDSFRGYMAFTGLGGNVLSGAKQLMGIGAFALELGFLDFSARLAETTMTPAGWKAARMVYDSAQGRARRRTGFNEVVSNALREAEARGPAWARKTLRALMAVPQFGDAVAGALIGGSLYRTYLSDPKLAGLAPDEAHRRALEKTFGVIERTQQSAYMKDLALWLRRGGSFARLAAQFTSALSQQAAYESQAIREFWARRDSESGRKLANAVFVNHVVLPAMQNLAVNGFRWLLGEEPPDDEDERARWLVSMIAGPASGIVLLGAVAETITSAVVKGQREYLSSFVPAERLLDDAETATLALRAVVAADWDEAMEESERLLKSMMAPYRHGRTLYENRIAP